MVMKIGCEVEQQLIVSLEFDDGSVKVRSIAKGDYVSISYNKNGMRRLVNGVISTIYANPYSGKNTKKDWYIVLSDDEARDGTAARVAILNILDIEVLHPNRSDRYVSTPNNATRVTDLRVKADYLQISVNGGRSWRNVGPLNDDPIGMEGDIDRKVKAMIGSDQYASTDEFIRGITEIIKEEVRKRRRRLPEGEDIDDGRHPDTTMDDSSDHFGDYF